MVSTGAAAGQLSRVVQVRSEARPFAIRPVGRPGAPIAALTGSLEASRRSGLQLACSPSKATAEDIRTTAAKRFKRVESATALIWKLLLVAEKRFRRLDAPHLLKDVFEGRKFEDGKPVSTQQRKNAA